MAQARRAKHFVPNIAVLEVLQGSARIIQDCSAKSSRFSWLRIGFNPSRPWLSNFFVPFVSSVKIFRVFRIFRGLTPRFVLRGRKSSSRVLYFRGQTSPLS